MKTAGARRDEAKARLALLKAGPWQPDIEIARAQVTEALSRGARRSRFEPHVGHGLVTCEILQCKVRGRAVITDLIALWKALAGGWEAAP